MLSEILKEIRQALEKREYPKFLYVSQSALKIMDAEWKRVYSEARADDTMEGGRVFGLVIIHDAKIDSLHGWYIK